METTVAVVVLMEARGASIVESWVRELFRCIFVVLSQRNRGRSGVDLFDVAVPRCFANELILFDELDNWTWRTGDSPYVGNQTVSLLSLRVLCLVCRGCWRYGVVEQMNFIHGVSVVLGSFLASDSFFLRYIGVFAD